MERSAGDVKVLSIGGKIDTLSSSDVEKKLNGLIDGGAKMLVIDFSKTEYISSSGLRALLAGLKKVRKIQGDMKLVAMKPTVRQVFEIAGFTRLFDVFELEEDAIRKFGA